MTVPSLHVELPNDGFCLHYRDNTHAYWSCSGGEDHKPCKPRLSGASSLGKALDLDPAYLLRWAAQTDHAGIAELARQARSFEELEWLMDRESIGTALKDSKLSYLHARDRKAATGTAVHGAFEALAKDEIVDLSHVPDEEMGYTRAVLDWWTTRNPKVINCEQFVLSHEYSFAGRFDLRAEIDGKTVLTDLKTSKWVGPSYHGQLLFYDLAARECGVGASEVLQVLQVKEDGSWKEVPCAISEDEALAALTCYRASKRLEKARRAA